MYCPLSALWLNGDIMCKKIELLAPAGSLKTVYDAANSGADAIYAGGLLFGARAYANNLSEQEIIEAIEFLHLHNKKLYLTVNTLLKDDEIKNQLFNYLEKLYINGLDAIIVQDIGVLTFIRKYFPQISVHCSTQMGIMGVESAKLAKSLGADRVVTARELSLKEIEVIHKNVDIEIESFCHGALCYSYSGQCLFSSVIGGRSGNRGRCAQPCRLPYTVSKNNRTINNKDNKYILSLKDMCLIDSIPNMADAGVYSYKIEGRMKRSEYCSIVVGIYRKYMDMYLSGEEYKVSKEDYEILMNAGNRMGFSKGYYYMHNDKKMVTLKKPDYDKGTEEFFDEYSKKYIRNIKEKIKGKIILHKEKPAILELSYNVISVVSEGSIVMKAINQPLSQEKIIKQINKLGNSGFEFEELKVEADYDIFIPVKELNELRRNAVEILKIKILEKYKRNDIKEFTSDKNEKNEYNNSISLTVYVEKLDYAYKALEFDQVKAIYFNYDLLKNDDIVYIIKLCKQKDKKIYLSLPYIFRNDIKEYFEEIFYDKINMVFDGIVIRNFDEYAWIMDKEYDGELITDYSLYSFNSYGDRFFFDNKIDRITIPVELNEKEIRRLYNKNKELIVYGYIPLLVSAQCVNKTLGVCSKSMENLGITDRYNKEFVIRSYCDSCYNVLYNSAPIVLADKMNEIKKLGVAFVRLNFTIEDEYDVKNIINHFIKAINGEEISDNDIISDFTRGHFTRGIE